MRLSLLNYLSVAILVGPNPTKTTNLFFRWRSLFPHYLSAIMAAYRLGDQAALWTFLFIPGERVRSGRRIDSPMGIAIRVGLNPIIRVK